MIIARRVAHSVVVTALAFLAPLKATEWKPVTPEELALKAPRVEKDADAEIIFWDVRVGDEQSGGYIQTVMNHYIRTKIFTEAGKEKLGTVDIPYFKNTVVAGIAGRTIKPDGSIVPLTKDAVYDRLLAKGGGLKIKHKSFAMPGIEPGSIIEYQWQETTSDELANYVHLPLQREFPVESLTYHIKPLVSPYFPFRMNSLTFNCDQPKFVQESKGYVGASFTNVPAYHTEQWMPPENETKRWMLIYYEPEKNLPPDKFWKDLGKEIYKRTEAELKINGDVKSLAQDLVSGAANDDEKLKKLLTHCHTKLKNINTDQVTSEEREAAKANHNSADTIKRGMGTSNDIQMAFVALATAAGFKARVARMADRGQSFFRKNYLTGYFLRSFDVAVEVDGKWRFYDPSSPDIPAGMLRWEEEGLDALISDPKEPVFERTPVTPADQSSIRRVVVLSLDEEGNLEGTVRETRGGQFGLSWRREFMKSSAQEREQNLKDQLQAQFGSAEVSDVFFYAADPAAPVVTTYKIKIANYAQRTGKRIFLAPSLFSASKQARFTAGTRQYPIYFDFPWAEVDHVEIALPIGYELDHPDAPGSFRFAPIGNYSVKMSLTATHKLIFDRKFVFGETSDVLFFEPALYPSIKKVFDQVHEADTHLITLKAAQPATAPATTVN